MFGSFAALVSADDNVNCTYSRDSAHACSVVGLCVIGYWGWFLVPSDSGGMCPLCVRPGAVSWCMLVCGGLLHCQFCTHRLPGR